MEAFIVDEANNSQRAAHDCNDNGEEEDCWVHEDSYQPVSLTVHVGVLHLQATKTSGHEILVQLR